MRPSSLAREDGEAVGDADGEEDVLLRGDQGVGGELALIAVADFGLERFGVFAFAFRLDEFDHAAVDLGDPGARGQRDAEGELEALVVFLEVGVGVGVFAARRGCRG